MRRAPRPAGGLPYPRTCNSQLVGQRRMVDAERTTDDLLGFNEPVDWRVAVAQVESKVQEASDQLLQFAALRPRPETGSRLTAGASPSVVSSSSRKTL